MSRLSIQVISLTSDALKIFYSLFVSFWVSLLQMEHLWQFWIILTVVILTQIDFIVGESIFMCAMSICLVKYLTIWVDHFRILLKCHFLAHSPSLLSSTGDISWFLLLKLLNTSFEIIRLLQRILSVFCISQVFWLLV